MEPRDSTNEPGPLADREEVGMIESAEAGSQRPTESSRAPSLAALEQALALLPRRAPGLGSVQRLVRRVEGGLRESPGEVQLSPSRGFPGDAWERTRARDPAMQLAVMDVRVAQIISAGGPLERFGDQLFLDLDLGAEALPPGSRLQVGDALLQVTPEPHNGCAKFQARFGADALRFVSARARRFLNLRGIYLQVVAEGRVALGDAVRVLPATVTHAPAPLGTDGVMRT